MIQINKDIWVNIMNVIWVQDVYDETNKYLHTKIVTIGGDLIVTDLWLNKLANY